MTVLLRLLAPDGATVRDFPVDTFPARLGRDPAAEVPVGEDAFRMVSAVHAEIRRTAAGLVVTPRSQKNVTLLNGRPITEPTPLGPGDRIGLGATGPTVLVLSAGETAAEGVATVAARPAEIAALRRLVATTLTAPVGDGGVLGRDPDARFHLPHPLVSRYHASLGRRDGQVVLS